MGFFKGPVTAIAQTPDGYLWLGTQSGLVRFDGVQVTPWVPPSAAALPSTNVQSLLATRDGTLWIGAFGGLASWNSHELKQYRELAGLFVMALTEGHDGTVWAGGFAYGGHGKLCAIRGQEVRCSGDDGRLGQGVVGLYFDSQGSLWAGTLGGFWHWAPGPPRFYAVSEEPYGIQCFSEDDTHSLLIPIKGRVARFHEGAMETAFAYPAAGRNDVCKMLRDKDGGLWIGNLAGLIRAHGGRTESYTEVDGLTRNAVNVLFEDREGSIWAGTIGGLDRFSATSVRTFAERDGIAGGLDPSVAAGRDGSIWYAGGGSLVRLRNGGVELYRGPEAKRVDAAGGHDPFSAQVTIRDLPKLELAKLFEDAEQRLWIINQDSVGYLEGGRFIASGAPGGAVYWLASEAAGKLWISTFEHGLLHVGKEGLLESRPWQSVGQERAATAGTVRPSDGSLWLGFPTGSIVALDNGKIGASYNVSNGLPTARVSDLRFEDDVLWAATDGGLVRLRHASVHTLSVRSGLPCDRLWWSLRARDGSLWLYGACGLMRIEDQDLQKWASGAIQTVPTTLFDESDGVSVISDVSGAPGPHAALATDGKLWFATTQGLSDVDPEHLALNRVPPPVHIERVVADGRTVSLAGALRLPPLVHDLTISYTALSFVAPERIHFRYQLEGQDTNSREAINKREVQYSNLAPGPYRFRVIASNDSGVWNEGGDAFSFSIAPAFWQTWWFRASCAAALATLIYLLYQMRMRQLAGAFAASLDARVAERLRIARDLHDTLLQSFQGVLFQFRAALRMVPTEPEKAQDVLAGAIDEAARAITEGRDAVQGLRASAEEPDDLAASIARLGNELRSSQRAKPALAVQVEVDGTARPLHPIVRDEVFRIAAEALHNAFAHSGGTQVEVELQYRPHQFRLRVRDDGRGIDPEVRAKGGRHRHFGLRGMRERAALAGGKFTVWSAPNSGTELELVIAASKAYAGVLSARPGRGAAS